MYKLKNTGSPYDEFVLKTGAYRLGSASDNEIVLEDSSVSAHHCEIVVTANTISLRDLSASHETYVDDERVESTQLRPGQTLRIGTMVLVLKGDTEAAAAGATSGGAQGPASAAPAAKRTIKIPTPVAWAALLLVALAVIGTIIYTNWPSHTSEKQTPTKTPPGEAAKIALAAARKKEKPAEKSTAKEASGAAREPRPDRTLEDSAHGSSAAGTNLASNPADDPPISQAMLEIVQRPFDPNDVARPPQLDVEAAKLRMQEGDFPRAAPFLHRALRSQQGTFGPESPEVTKTLDTLGNAYRNMRQFDQAEPLLQQVLRNVEKIKGPEHPETARALDKVGENYLATGQNSKAAPLLEHALKVREKALPPDHPEVAASLKNLAAAHVAQGEYAKAKPLLERALKISETALGPDDPKLAQSLDALGEISRALGDTENAEPLLQRALSLKERTLPPDDPGTAPTLKSLADLHAAKGDFAKAELLYQRALEISEKAAGPIHPATAEALNDLARLHQKKGDAEKAAPLFQRAAEAAEKSLGPEHPQTVLALRNLAGLNGCQEDPASGLEPAKKAVRAQFQLLSKIVRYGSEQQRLAFRDRLNPYSLAATLNTVPELASAILRCKGVVLDSLIEDRLIAQAGQNPEVRKLTDKVQATKDDLATTLFEIPENLSENARGRRQADANTMATYLKALEGDLAKQVPGWGRASRALEVSLDKVKGAIPQHSVLLEWIRFSCCLETNRWEPCYGVVVLSPTGDPRWVTLGSAKAIEETVANCQNAIEGGAGISSLDSTNAPASLSSLLHTLYQQLWVPVEPLLPTDTKTVIISPDRALNLVSFATLRTANDQFLGEKFSIRYVASGRDLLEEKKPLRKGRVFVFGNPDFSAAMADASQSSDTKPMTTRSPVSPELQSLRFSPLSGASQEVALIHVQATGWDWPVTLFFGANASEPELAAARSPRILHLATRAFLLPASAEEIDAEEIPSIRKLESFYESSFANTPTNTTFLPAPSGASRGAAPLSNPLHRSGLALAGAQSTLQATDRNENSRPGHDGILTADLVGTLKLEGTELVVMSACDAVTGGVRSSEALLALRRAFLHAGAQNLLIAMRPEVDQDAANMMAHFYRRFHEIGDAPQALADVQRDWLVRLHKEQGLPAAVRVAGSFMMTSQGSAP
jgi:tetratricopeptide (TPR) repeat protein/CHAT domain-containing protein